MRIEELSVNDWVAIDGKPIQISSVYATPLGGVVKYDHHNLSVFIEVIEPIPLTDEILEKNGWVLDKSSRWHICEITFDTRVNVWIGGTNQCRVEISTRTDELDWYFCYADFKLINPAVHQLQHALRLAGIEKEIEL